jgi:hypothetical protein
MDTDSNVTEYSDMQMKKKNAYPDKPNDRNAIPKWLLIFLYVVLFIQLYNLIGDLI